VLIPFKATPFLIFNPLCEQCGLRVRNRGTWVWDHSSRKAPHLPVIRMGDGTLRYRASRIEEFIDERERLTNLRRKRG